MRSNLFSCKGDYELGKEDGDNLYNFVMDVFNAGRVSGVRQERYRRREARQEWFPDLQY